ncbi:DUSAM domain-containing protein [Stigmatella sp. ncwal1]|uniref:DUSAM domain-containing protein n=1 Tax=Stigmatella ashevillensis TaxID=2995309 RepID=A0ABT5D1N8_9BACT|nr:DUSAM domain-containing protein [Stigmatella ashevillena]MDC0707580.1 DUSAM domain-containing protein [Stigmatella ashevillena]
MTAEIDWGPIRALGQRVIESGEPLELTDEVRSLLRRSASEVAIPPEDAENALRSVPTATTLLGEITRRIREGSDRLGEARHRAYDLRDTGDLDGACRQMEEVLAVEVVPLYRKRAESMIRETTRLKSVAASGQPDPKLSDRAQLPVLLHRVQQGHPLELTEGMRAFLRRAAADVGMSEAETEPSLGSPERAGALLGQIRGRLRDASDRLEGAMSRMMELRDAGDLEGARQQIRDWLAVEVVPRYRRAAEENLAGLDEPPPGPLA